jgi:repressor LexA
MAQAFGYVLSASCLYPAISFLQQEGRIMAVSKEPTQQGPAEQRSCYAFGDVIRKYRSRLKYNQRELGKLMGVNQNTICNWETDKNQPDAQAMRRLCLLLDIPLYELFGIEDKHSKLSERELLLLSFYRSLDEHGKEDLETFAEAMSSNVHKRRLRMALERMNSVEDRGRAAAAGDGADWEDHPECEHRILFDSRAVSEADEVMTVNGQSMEPMFHDGDRVLVQYCADLSYGDVGIFYVPGMGGVIKQVAHDRLHSLNPDYDDIFPYEDGAKIIGRVLGKITEDMIPDADEQALYLEARKGC